jgi:hypothetical protein
MCEKLKFEFKIQNRKSVGNKHVILKEIVKGKKVKVRHMSS